MDRMERFPTHGASAAGAQDEPISHPPSRPLPEPGLACPGFVRASSGRGFPAPLRSWALVAGKLWGSLPMRLRALPRQGPHHQPTKRLRGKPSMTSALRCFSGPSAALARIFHSRERTGGFCGGARFGFPNGVVHRLWFAGHKARQVRGRVISAIGQEMWRQCSPGWNFWKGPGLPMVVSRRPDTTRPALGHSARSSTAPATPDSSAPALGAHSP